MHFNREASSGKEGISLARRVEPDLILLDLQMKGMNGIETALALREAGLDARIVMLTVSDNGDDLVSAIRAGADGYLLKDMEPEGMLAQLKEALSGRMVISDNLSGLLAQCLRAEAVATHRHISALTEREKVILANLVKGRSNKLIGRELNITEGTVKVHVKNLLKKLSFRSRVEAAVWAAGQGLRA